MDERLYLIAPTRPDLDAFLEAAVRGGVDIVQIREKAMPDGELLPRLQEARDELQALEAELQSEIAAVAADASDTPLDVVEIKPKRGAVDVQLSRSMCC